MATLQGVYTATVLDNRDREGLARVFVRVPGIADAGIWARIATMMAGQNRGTLFVPDVDDEVLVAFERGDQRIPTSSARCGMERTSRRCRALTLRRPR